MLEILIQYFLKAFDVILTSDVFRLNNNLYTSIALGVTGSRDVEYSTYIMLFYLQ